MSKVWIESFKETPILLGSQKALPELVTQLPLQSEAWEIEPGPRLILENRYLKDGLKGSHPKMFARAAVVVRLHQIIEMLAPDYGLMIFDSFRSTTCQRDIFDKIHAQLRTLHPDKPGEWIWQETRKYVVHPDETSRYPVAPHNSGGAIDLTLWAFDEPLDMGGAFDDPHLISSTDYFERPFDPAIGISPARWESVRRNRRILFHAMRHFGFTNYRDEWWHYDLGDCMWAQESGLSWVYHSMEAEVVKLCTASIH
jgi:D-alanyl-D-alanine dipeptidase